MQIRNFQKGHIVKIIEKDENYGKIGLIRIINFDDLILDNMETRSNKVFKVGVEKVDHCDDLDFIVKAKIRLDFNILKLQSQVEEEHEKFLKDFLARSNGYQIELSKEIYLKDQFEGNYGKQIANLISYIKFRNFEIGKSMEDLQEILLRLEVKVTKL